MSVFSGTTGCGCQYETYGCCEDGRTPARGPEQAGCGCESSKFGCCPDGVTPASGKLFDGCKDGAVVIPGGEGLDASFAHWKKYFYILESCRILAFLYYLPLLLIIP